jgi:hypothetical protein
VAQAAQVLEQLPQWVLLVAPLLVLVLSLQLMEELVPPHQQLQVLPVLTASSPYLNCFISTVAPVAEARVLRQVPPTAGLAVQAPTDRVVVVEVVHLPVALQEPVVVAVTVLLLLLAGNFSI